MLRGKLKYDVLLLLQNCGQTDNRAVISTERYESFLKI